MVTITQHPSDISLAGNPVLLNVYSGLSEKTFLKICAEVNVSIYQRSSLLASFTRTLSIPTSGGNEAVVFDLSDIMQSALSQLGVERCKALADGGVPSYTSGYVRYTAKVWDEYLDEHAEVVSTKDSASSSTGVKYAIPGAYTDMQRLLRPEDTESFLGSAKILSNKPDFEVVPAGGSMVVPVYSNSSKSLSVRLNEGSGSSLGSASLYANEVSWCKVSLPSSVSGLNSLVFGNISVPPVFFYAVPGQPFATCFEFVNRLGAVESVYTYGRRQLKRKLTQERQTVRHNKSFRPNARYVKRTLQEEETIVMSTGPVSREWAKWFVSEFFVAEKTWMYSDDASDMIPVIIECDEDLSVFNESEAEVLDLQFTVVKCING